MISKEAFKARIPDLEVADVLFESWWREREECLRVLTEGMSAEALDRLRIVDGELEMLTGMSDAPLWPVYDGHGLGPQVFEDQKRRGWPDYPEEHVCGCCGAWNVPLWFAPHDQFRAAMKALGGDEGAVACPRCFAKGMSDVVGSNVEIVVVALDVDDASTYCVHLRCPQCEVLWRWMVDVSDPDRREFSVEPCPPCQMGAVRVKEGDADA